jgi:surfeit locus 1 family protein
VRRLPLLPTAIVALAVAAMVALGLWQLLDRRPAKLAFIAQLRDNPARPPIAFPRFPDDRLLFRRASGFCLQPTAIRQAGAGASGFRLIAECRTGAEGPGMAVQLGTTRDPKATMPWRGGEVRGYLGHAPDERPVLAGLYDHTPQRMLLVMQPQLPGLGPNLPPDPESVPNNHLSYAVQWFFFAAVATVIYLLALRRRDRALVTPPPGR